MPGHSLLVQQTCTGGGRVGGRAGGREGGSEEGRREQLVQERAMDLGFPETSANQQENLLFGISDHLTHVKPVSINRIYVEVTEVERDKDILDGDREGEWEERMKELVTVRRAYTDLVPVEKATVASPLQPQPQLTDGIHLPHEAGNLLIFFDLALWQQSHERGEKGETDKEKWMKVTVAGVLSITESCFCRSPVGRNGTQDER